MKVLFFCSGNNGVSPIIKAQADSLIQNGVDVEIFPLIGKGFWGYLKFIRKLKRQIASSKFDTIHAHYSFCGIVASLSTIKPVICSLMGSDIIAAKSFQFVIKLFSHIFWKATIVKSVDMKSRIGVRKCLVIPNGVDIITFKPLNKLQCRAELGWNSEVKIALFVGDPDRFEKNCQLAENAIKLLGSDTIELKVANAIPHKDIAIYINASDVLLLPSLWEGSPNIVKEAMACNIPVVSTDVGDVKWLFGDVQGYFMAQSKPYAFAEAIKNALSFRETNGRDRILVLGLDSISVAEKLKSVYLNCISGKV